MRFCLIHRFVVLGRIFLFWRYCHDWSIDHDRSLNNHVWCTLVATLPETSKKERNIVAASAASISALIVWGLLIYMLKTGNTLSVSAEIASLRWKLSLDPLGMVYAVIVSTLWVFTAVYSFGYMEKDQNQRRYFIFFLLSAGVTLGIAFSGNLFTLYLFYELLTLCTYPLMIHEGQRRGT